MSEMRPNWSRRRLLRYSSVGIALAVAGCGQNEDGTDDGESDGGGTDGSEPDDGDTTDDGQSDDDEGAGNNQPDGGELPDDPATAFELAGDGADRYRDWLVPEYTLDANTDGGIKQLYQFNNFELAAQQGWDSRLLIRDDLAESLGVDPESVESEILVGPVEDGVPNRIFFGSFETETITETLRSAGLEQTAEDGEFTIFDDRLAVSGTVVFEHQSYGDFLETARGEAESFGETHDDVRLLLEVVPAGALVTLSSREDGDLVADAMTVVDFDEEGNRSRAIRTLVFRDASAVTSERIRELVVENSIFEEILTEESQGRVAMAEVRR